MKKFSWLIAGAIASVSAAMAVFCAEVPQLTAKDLSTADGSARVGLQADNHIVCILTATEARVKLIPDSWSSDEEANNWTSWLTAFDDALYSRWLKNASTDGQETVSFKIANGAINATNGTFLQAAASPGQNASDNSQQKFEATIKSALDETLKNAPPMPTTKNKLNEVKTTLTFMRDQKIVPRFGEKAFGLAAVATDDKAIQAYGAINKKDGRSPGIQIMQEKGSIQVLDRDEFNKKSEELLPGQP